MAKETVAILENNKATLEKNLFETEKLFENGLGDEESVEQLQITLSNVDNALKNINILNSFKFRGFKRSAVFNFVHFF